MWKMWKSNPTRDNTYAKFMDMSDEVLLVLEKATDSTVMNPKFPKFYWNKIGRPVYEKVGGRLIIPLRDGLWDSIR